MKLDLYPEEQVARVPGAVDMPTIKIGEFVYVIKDQENKYEKNQETEQKTIR